MLTAYTRYHHVIVSAITSIKAEQIKSHLPCTFQSISAHRTIKCFKKIKEKKKMFISRSIGLYILLNFNVLCREQRLSFKLAYPEDEEKDSFKPNAQVDSRKCCIKLAWFKSFYSNNF